MLQGGSLSTILSQYHTFINHLANLTFVEEIRTEKGLKSTYYPEVEKILKRTKKTVRYFLLTPVDIEQLDLLTQIYLRQDNAYFYINKIDSWQKGTTVKVELFKLY